MRDKIPFDSALTQSFVWPADAASFEGDSTGLQTTHFERKVRLLFLGTFLTIVLYAITATIGLISASRSQEQLLKNQIQDLFLRQDFELAVASLATSVRGYVNRGEDRFKQSTQKFHAETLNLFYRIQSGARSPREVELIAKTKLALDHFLLQTEAMIKLREEGRSRDEIFAQFREMDVPNLDNIQMIYEGLEAETKEQLEIAKTEALATVNWSMMLFGFAAMLSFLIFGSLFWVLARLLQQQRKIEADLAIREMLSRQAIALTGIGIFDHDQVHDQLYFSPQMREISGLTEEDSVTLPNYVKQIPPEDRDRVAASIRQAHDPDGPGSFDVTHCLIRRDGSIRWVMTKSQTFFGTYEGKIKAIRTIGTQLDITKLKEVELSLREALEKLAKKTIQLERSNSELDQFASIAAHDLRAPLTSMLGWVGIMDRNLPQPRSDEVAKAIAFIAANTKKADALIGDILAMARLNDTSIKDERVDLNKVVQDQVTLLQDLISATGARVIFDRLPNVKGCHSHFESLFGNLLRNAITYGHKDRLPEIYITSSEQGDFHEFVVTDNGIGISPQYRVRIFQMFQRLHSEKNLSGTGIGLAYCKKIVEIYGGHIWVNSELGTGSSFHFTFPSHLLERQIACDLT